MQVVTYADIVEDLSRLPLPKSPILFVHSSLKSFGYVIGGAKTVIDALHHTVGDYGTLVLPTLSFKSIKESAPVFDARTTPSDTGYITEYFRQNYPVYRSLHIFSSVCALGEKANWLTNWHNDTPCGPNTPYKKIIDENGFSLFLGTTLSANSLFHCAEEVANPPYLGYKTIKNAKVIDLMGNEYFGDYRKYDCSLRGIPRYLAKMDPFFRENSAIFDTYIGSSKTMLISAQDNFHICCDILSKQPEYITSPAE